MWDKYSWESISDHSIDLETEMVNKPNRIVNSLGDFANIGQQKHPPDNLLPPFPPAVSEMNHRPLEKPSSKTKLPQISKLRKADLLARNHVPNKSTMRRVRRHGSLIDAQVETEHLDSVFRCLLCGLDCVRGDLLYAHLLILKHNSANQLAKNYQPQADHKSNLQLNCRRCGRFWESSMESSNINQHGCVQQKAAYLSGFLAPRDAVRHGLPFICLFCCTERRKRSHRPVLKFEPQRAKSTPLKACETSMRFQSKLHLVVHILCRHAVRRRRGTCAECPFGETNLYLDEEMNEKSFWDTQKHVLPFRSANVSNQHVDKLEEKSSNSDSDISTVSLDLHTDNDILRREGLPPLELHIDLHHLPVFELLTWCMIHSMPSRSVAAHGRRSNMYNCPLCDLNNYRILPHLFALTGQEESNRIGELQGRQYHISSNAMLQAHIACYHSGANELDALIELCQVCETTDFMRITSRSYSERCTQHLQGSLKHLMRAGHVHRLQQQFDLCISQGRLNQYSLTAKLDWSTVCLFCWKRFATHLGDPMGNLIARCRLQTHLLVQHCSGLSSEHVPYQSRDMDLSRRMYACGWCGDTACMQGDTAISDNTECANTWKPLKDPHYRRLIEQYRWFQAHEEQHASGLASWWWTNLQKQGVPADKQFSTNMGSCESSNLSYVHSKEN